MWPSSWATLCEQTNVKPESDYTPQKGSGRFYLLAVGESSGYNQPDMNWNRRLSVILISFALALTGCSTLAGGGSSQPKAVTNIQNKGSDTMVNLALAWAEQYQSEHPEVSLSVTGGGSGTGIASLLNNTVDIANASRKITDGEISEAKKNGIDPVQFTVARDAIGVIVNPNNPVNQLTLQQISDIYSGKIRNWSEVGGENRPIVKLSRETNSGTHVYFLESVIRLGKKGDKTIFSADTLLLPSSEGIISEVRDNPNAIGYDGLGYITPEVKTLGIAKDGNSPAVLPSVATVNDNTYPVSRDLYMYINGQPKGALKDYLDWIVSQPAQDIVRQLGFIPILHPGGQ
jgi:phosphate transport system substrate-binding protein